MCGEPSSCLKVREKPSIAVYALVVSVAIFLAISAYVFNFGFTISDRHEVWGQFGDYLGGILNPFFSFITIIILIYTIVLQNKELEASRKDFHNNFIMKKSVEEKNDIINLLKIYEQEIDLYNSFEVKNCRGSLISEIRAIVANNSDVSDAHPAHLNVLQRYLFISRDILRLVSRYDNLSDNRSFARYYSYKYSDVFEYLKCRCMITEDEYDWVKQRKEKFGEAA